MKVIYIKTRIIHKSMKSSYRSIGANKPNDRYSSKIFVLQVVGFKIFKQFSLSTAKSHCFFLNCKFSFPSKSNNYIHIYIYIYIYLYIYIYIYLYLYIYNELCLFFFVFVFFFFFFFFVFCFGFFVYFWGSYTENKRQAISYVSRNSRNSKLFGLQTFLAGIGRRARFS